MKRSYEAKDANRAIAFVKMMMLSAKARIDGKFSVKVTLEISPDWEDTTNE